MACARKNASAAGLIGVDMAPPESAANSCWRPSARKASYVSYNAPHLSVSIRDTCAMRNSPFGSWRAKMGDTCCAARLPCRAHPRPNPAKDCYRARDAMTGNGRSETDITADAISSDGICWVTFEYLHLTSPCRACGSARCRRARRASRLHTRSCRGQSHSRGRRCGSPGENSARP
jgi:hypothetical protein